MDLKRYERITGREALGKLLEGQRVFFEAQGEVHHYEISDNHLFVTTKPNSYSYATLESFLKETDANWYVKKPFDVRAEMLARPDEWVGAFKSRGVWNKVRFNSVEMLAEETAMGRIDVVMRADADEIEQCIPIEDVPKGEFL